MRFADFLSCAEWLDSLFWCSNAVKSIVCVCVCIHVFTNRQIGEDTEGALKKSNQVNQVVAGSQILASGHRSHPVVISQLQELVNLCIQAGVDLRLCSMTSILREKIVTNREF